MIKKILKCFLPKPIRARVILARKAIRYTARKYCLKLAVKRKKPLKILVGAAETHQKGWLATNEQWLDIANKAHWDKFFKREKLIRNIVAEHVLEHLTAEEASVALIHMHSVMISGGRVRIAVPDGYNPNEEYIRHVKIGGIGDDAADHQQLLNVESLSALLERAGFVSEHVEGFRADGTLIQNTWDENDGFVRRSRQNTYNEPWTFPDASTSLIVDGLKK